MAIEIVDLPIKNGDFPWLCKRLPEGRSGKPPRLPFALPSGPVVLWPWRTCKFRFVRNPKWLVDSCQPLKMNKVIAYHCPTYRIYIGIGNQNRVVLHVETAKNEIWIHQRFTTPSQAVLSAWQGQASHPSLKSPFFMGQKPIISPCWSTNNMGMHLLYRNISNHVTGGCTSTNYI